jgi:hypothetical protein
MEIDERVIQTVMIEPLWKSDSYSYMNTEEAMKSYTTGLPCLTLGRNRVVDLAHPREVARVGILLHDRACVLHFERVVDEGHDHVPSWTGRPITTNLGEPRKAAREGGLNPARVGPPGRDVHPTLFDARQVSALTHEHKEMDE